jgi:hypothetical protein
MANKFFGAISHIGGADGDLDAISKDIISDGDGGFVLDATNNTIDLYTLDASNATAEDAVNFTTIVPDDEAASPGKRWIKVEPGWGFIKTLTSIAAALKSGADATLVTGTAGANTDIVVWNADGDAVSRALNTIGVLATAAEWTAQQNFNEAAITSSGNAVAWDVDTAQCALHTLTENTTISAPTNLNAGATYNLRVVQAAGVFTLAWNAVFKWGTATTPAAPAANGDVAVFSFYSDGTNMYGAEMNRTEA